MVGTLLALRVGVFRGRRRGRLGRGLREFRRELSGDERADRGDNNLLLNNLLQTVSVAFRRGTCGAGRQI
ncbi:MAG TPA: hypothetical protein VMV69_15195 [Pirellulales bacterium]|nr:hypothetical protein [Pirellulales bacterium]